MCDKINASCYRYISVLVDLTRIYGTHHGKLIASQLLDVAVRVQSIRHFAVQQMVKENLFVYFLV